MVEYDEADETPAPPTPAERRELLARGLVEDGAPILHALAREDQRALRRRRFRGMLAPLLRKLLGHLR
jgi:hypothetical protein